MTDSPVGAFVQTPLGKGTVREHRRNGSVVVVIGGRVVVFPAADVTPVDPARTTRRTRSGTVNSTEIPEAVRPTSGPAEVDLHGLSVDEAVERSTKAIDAALIEGRLQLRIIHGRSGGRLRAAVHRLLRDLPSVPGFRVDPSNPGVTIVDF